MMISYTRFIAGAVLAMAGIVSAPVVHAQATSEYSPLIRTGYTDYKTHYAPTSDYLARSSGEVTIVTSHGNIQAGKVKIFVPPGSKRFTVSFQTYAMLHNTIQDELVADMNRANVYMASPERNIEIKGIATGTSDITTEMGALPEPTQAASPALFYQRLPQAFSRAAAFA